MKNGINSIKSGNKTVVRNKRPLIRSTDSTYFIEGTLDGKSVFTIDYDFNLNYAVGWDEEKAARHLADNLYVSLPMNDESVLKLTVKDAWINVDSSRVVTTSKGLVVGDDMIKFMEFFAKYIVDQST
jgi:hypothetical protein